MKLCFTCRDKKNFWFAAILAALVWLPGCGGYYNTFYNTKKVYKEAAEERKRRPANDPRPGSGEIQKYDKAIEKASKLLQLHPNSRYVDDALVLIGECFFYKQEYLKAQRKFQELTSLFPKSSLVPRAQLWLAKTNIELNDYAGAEQVLRELEAREKKGETVNQARYLLGEIHFRQKQYESAAQEYEAAAQKLGDDKIRSEAYRRLGECSVELKQFNRAAAAFRRAGAAIKNDINLKFTIRLQYAIALKNDQKPAEALNVLNTMLKEFSNHRELPLVKLEIAECARAQGKIESAVKQFAALIENHQRTDAAAAAYFALGEINERKSEFTKAKENYDNVRRESSRYEKVNEAERRSKAIGALIKLKETVATLERQRNLLAGQNQPGAAPQLADNTKEKKSSDGPRPISRFPRRARNIEAAALAGAAAKDPQKIAADLAKSKILLAELYLFNFSRPDSAMREYLDVFEFFPQTEYAPQAMYSLAYILGDAPATLAMRDSILLVLAGKYGDTPQGLGAKRRLGRADTMFATQLAPALIRQAEENLFKQKDPQRAVRLYEEFLQRQPDSKYAAQSLYAMGWIYEHELADNKQALTTYKKLIETYPDSPMARRVRSKVSGAEQPAKSNPPLAAAPANLPPDSTAAKLHSDSTAINLPPEAEKPAAPVIDDETPRAQRRNNAPPVKDDDVIKPPADKAQKDQKDKDDDPPEDDEEETAEPPEPPQS